MNKNEVDSDSDSCVTLKFSVCYIVAAVIIEDGKVLMIQEAKRSCFGKWYLPAGRLEAGETLYEGVQREVLEESGLSFLPEALTLVEARGVTWYRFTFTGKINGGKLKSLDDADKESLQATWLDLDTVLEGKSKDWPLRASDVGICIKATQDCLSRRLSDWAFLPSTLSDHRQLFMKCIFARSKHSKEVLSTSDGEMVPFLKLRVSGGIESFKTVLFQYAMTTFSLKSPELKSTIEFFVIDVEHTGKLTQRCSFDGVVFTILGSMRDNSVEPDKNCNFVWKSLDDVLCLHGHVRERLKCDNPGAILDFE